MIPFFKSFIKIIMNWLQVSNGEDDIFVLPENKWIFSSIITSNVFCFSPCCFWSKLQHSLYQTCHHILHNKKTLLKISLIYFKYGKIGEWKLGLSLKQDIKYCSQNKRFRLVLIYIYFEIPYNSRFCQSEKVTISISSK